MTFTFCVSVYLKWRIRITQAKQQGTLDESENRKKFRAALRVLLYPLAFSLVWLPALVNRFYQGWNSPVFALALLQAISEPSLGIADTLVYLVTMRSTLWSLIRYGKKPKTKINDLTLDYLALENSKVCCGGCGGVGGDFWGSGE